MFLVNEQGQKKVKEVIDDIKTCMFTTTDEKCNVFSRPMFTIKVDNEGCLWFFTNEYSNKISDIITEKQVTLVYAHPGKNAYMNVYGTCSIVQDKNKMKELWIPALKAWFPGGVEDPAVCMLKVCITEALHWDNSTNEMVCLYKNEVPNPHNIHHQFQEKEEAEIFYQPASHW